MHELSLTRNIVAICAERAGERRVRAVRLRVGKLCGVEIGALRFCFDLVAQGTRLEGAALEIEEIEGRGTCTRCHEEVPLPELVGVCPCEERAPLDLVAGHELLIQQMETEG